LLENPLTNRHLTNALMALMCFQASRLEARVGGSGEIVLYQDQDASLWNVELISRGNYYLTNAAAWPVISVYFLEASIAYWHTIQEDSGEKWENILHLYNQLLAIAYSPIAALNRTYALAKVRGKETAIQEAEKLGLSNNHFYHMLLSELHLSQDKVKSRYHLQQAYSLCENETERKLIQKKLIGI
jgi:RNA polymerase sigma-70 factor (ECF subfamily)